MDYFNGPKKQWQKLLRISDEDIPGKLIIEGGVNYPKWIERRSGSLTNVRSAWIPSLIQGEFEGQLVGYGVCFGGPMASQFTHIYCKMGTGKIIQIGTGGGLQKDIELGDIVVSEGVLSLDGSARLYKQETDYVRFDTNLKEKVIVELKKGNIKHHVGKTVSYYDILLEEGRDLINLSNLGYLGVDMEAAAVGSVAMYFGVPAISIILISDNSITGKDLFYKQNEEEQKRIDEGMDRIFEVALSV
jgi:purine-nucleoside phosphorylase